MAEIRRGYDTGGGSERLPWLEPVEDEDYVEERGGHRGVILAVLALLLVVAMVAGGIAWMRGARAEQADIGTVIKAPPGPYKVRPPSPGGMEIASAGAVAERTGVGGDINSPLDLTAIPEQPVIGPGSADAPSSSPERGEVPRPQGGVAGQSPPLPQSVVQPAKPLRPSPAASNAPSLALRGAELGGSIQLGAFSTEAKAQSAWKALAKRFGFLAGLTQTVNPVEAGEATLYRLRASGPGAAGLCQRLRVAGESCSVV